MGEVNITPKKKKTAEGRAIPTGRAIGPRPPPKIPWDGALPTETIRAAAPAVAAGARLAAPPPAARPAPGCTAGDDLGARKVRAVLEVDTGTLTLGIDATT